jgi:hypothetical protein
VTSYESHLIGPVNFVLNTTRNYAQDIVMKDTVFAFEWNAQQVREWDTQTTFVRLILVAFIQAQICDQITFRFAGDSFPSAVSIAKRVAAGKFSSDSQACFRKLVVNPDWRRVNEMTRAEYSTLRRLATEKYGQAGDVIAINNCSQAAAIAAALAPRTVTVITDFADFKGIVKNVSRAAAMIAFDDNNRVMTSFWLPEKAPLILVVPPKGKVYSDAAARIITAGKQPIVVEGDLEGAVSDKPELFAKCVKGELDVTAEQCAQAYRNLSYTVAIEKIKAIVNSFK